MLNDKKVNDIKSFFEKLYGKSIEVKDYYVNLKGRSGAHEPGVIYINRTAPELDQELIYVHELNHEYQDHGYSYTVEDITTAVEEDAIIDYPIRRCEIDSRIVELVYAYEMFGDYGVNLLKDRLYKGCSRFCSNIEKAIFAMPDTKTKEILIKDLDEAYIKVYGQTY